MKLRVNTLCRELDKAKEGEDISSAELNTYLLEKVLRPTMEENPPRLSEIDFEQFEHDDIAELADYCERLGVISSKLGQFVGAVAAIPAIPCRARQFC